MLCVFYHNKNKKDWWRHAIVARVVKTGLPEEVAFEQRYK